MKPIYRTFFRMKKKKKPKEERPFQFNESVNFDLQCIYVAIPKTGSTSVRRKVASSGEFFIPGAHLSMIQVRDCLYAYHLLLSRNKNRAMPSKGVMENNAVRRLAEQQFANFFKFSVVRNPWARALSLYTRKQGVRTENSISFEEFIESHSYASDTCFWPTLHRNQYDWLCDEKGDLLTDFYCKIEEIERGRIDVLDRTNGRIDLDIQRLNTSPTSVSEKYRSFYNGQTKKIIEKRFEKDIDAFKYVF